MGNVFFDTEVNKNVNINKNVNVNVNKNVQTDVELNGSLASAEASADAVGGRNGNGNGERVVVPFNPDNLTEPQLVHGKSPTPVYKPGFRTPSPCQVRIPTSIPRRSARSLHRS